jgi:16S rRNA (guanine966-N2)-methyltransferase
MPDKLKAALFNILGDEVSGTDILDGFAGTGSVGIEALSRGARSAVFIDELPAAIRILKHNLAKCAAEGKSRIISAEFNRAVIRLSKEKTRFHIIFLDPPYRLLDERNPLKVVKKRCILRPGGLIVLRQHFKTRFEAKYFKLVKKTVLGDDALSFYKDA